MYCDRATGQAQLVFMDRLKMRDMKQRHSQKCRGGNCEKGNNETKMQWRKLWERNQRHENAGVEAARNGNCDTILQGVEMRHKPLWTAKRTL